jgi:hypothetical protein
MPLGAIPGILPGLCPTVEIFQSFLHALFECQHIDLLITLQLLSTSVSNIVSNVMFSFLQTDWSTLVTACQFQGIRKLLYKCKALVRVFEKRLQHQPLNRLRDRVHPNAQTKEASPVAGDRPAGAFPEKGTAVSNAIQ